MTNIIEIKNTDIKYNIFSSEKQARNWKEYFALSDINLTVKKGEAVALIGSNGAGKTTLLKVISGILAPDSGEAKVSGKVCSLLEAGAGFSPELSGYENIFLSAALLGMTKGEINKKLSDITDFADIGDFLYVPVKCYSQGMFVRLAFSIAVFCDPDILLVDDTFAVGDENFKTKALNKLFEFKQKGITMVFATHDMGIVSDFGTRALLLSRGKILNQGNVRDVLNFYMHLSGNHKGLGVLENVDMKLVFNNGSIFLYHKNKEITCGLGGYFNFKTGGVKYDSSAASWNVTEKDDHSQLTAIGRFLVDDAVSEVTVSAAEKGFNIFVKSECSDDLSEVKMHFMLPCSYNSWKIQTQNGAFPAITKESLKPLKIIQDNREAASFLLSAEQKGDYPDFFIKDNSSQYAYLVALNSGYRNYCRIIELSNDQHTLDYNFFIGLGCLGINNDVSPPVSTSVGSGDFNVMVADGKCSFLYKGNNIFDGDYVYTSIHTEEDIYNSLTPVLDADVISENEILVKIEHHRINAYEIWKISCDAEKGFCFEAELFLREDIKINNYTVVFFTDHRFSSWKTKTDKGVFPDIFLKGHWSDFLQTSLTGGELVLNSVDMDISFASADTFFRIYNWEKNVNRRCRIVECFAYDTSLEPAKKLLLQIGAKSVKHLAISSSEENAIADGALKVDFIDNKIRLHKNEVALTRRFGVYTAYAHNEIWHFSGDAVWQRPEIAGNKMILRNKFKSLPIIEKWIISISEDRVFFEVFVSVEKDIDITSFQFNLMASAKYTSFLDDKNSAVSFPEFLADTGPNWDKVFTSELNKVALRGDVLPDICLSVEDKCINESLGVLNTDIYHRNRLMQFLKKIKINKKADMHTLFKGVIY